MMLRCTWLVTVCVAVAHAADPPAAARSQEELMGARGFVRHRGEWRTVQEIELLERTAKAQDARREWKTRLARLRRQLDVAGTAERAATEIRGIADPAAVPAVVAAIADESSVQVRGWYVEALSRIRSPEAVAALVAVAVDHADEETRFAAVERVRLIGPHAAVPTLTAALASPDNARVNRAAAALGRLGVSSAVGPLIDVLQTKHVIVQGGGGEGSMTAGFTPEGGGLSMGSGPKKVTVVAKNDRVLEALVALTGKNFDWDVAAWRAWLASTQSPPPGYDPRRGGP